MTFTTTRPIPDPFSSPDSDPDPDSDVGWVSAGEELVADLNHQQRSTTPTRPPKVTGMRPRADPNHQCVDCNSTDLLDLDHNPPYDQTHRTITPELEPRCKPCHRARHRTAA